MDTTLYSALAESGLEMSKKLGGAAKHTPAELVTRLIRLFTRDCADKTATAAEDSGAFDWHACGAHVGVTPDSNGVAVVHYHAQANPPFFVGCYTDEHADMSVEECRQLYSGCSGASTTLTTDHGSGEYQQWCPWSSSS